MPDSNGGSGGTRIPSLTLLRGGLPGRMFRIDRDGITLGRQPDCDIQLDEGGVSRQHARITLRVGDALHIHDLESTNGTFVNGRRVERHRLRDGDKLQLGSLVVFRFNYQDALDEAFQRQQFDSITRDSLTGCHNRMYFDESLRRELAWVQRRRGAVAVALIDLDHFKLINDQHGHAVGDVVLHAVAQALYGALRTYDVLARYGGEEFAVLLRDAGQTDARTVGERLRVAVETLRILHEQRYIEPTASIGLALADEVGADSSAIMRLADQRLYAAKAAGRNCLFWGPPSDQGDNVHTEPVDGYTARQAIAHHRQQASGLEEIVEVGPDAPAESLTPGGVAMRAGERLINGQAATLVEGELRSSELEAPDLDAFDPPTPDVVTLHRGSGVSSQGAHEADAEDDGRRSG